MITQSVAEADLILNGLETKRKEDKIEILVNFSLKQTSRAMEQLITRFAMEPDVYFVNYIKCDDLDDDEN